MSVFLKKYREDFPEVIPPIVPSFMAYCTLVEVDLTKENQFFSSATDQ